MTDFGKSLPEDLQRVVAFHGHYCPGIMWGYLASKVALERLGADRAEDEELIAIVENDSCAADAVQVLTGCTFGKGNFFFRDWGKHVYTFAVRPSPQDPEDASRRGGTRAVRVSRLPHNVGARHVVPAPDDETREEKITRMLRTPVAELFKIEDVTIDLPAAAQIHDSAICTRCGEEAMITRMQEVDGKAVCLSCIEGGK